jgi:hypothetical protein
MVFLAIFSGALHRLLCLLDNLLSVHERTSISLRHVDVDYGHYGHGLQMMMIPINKAIALMQKFNQQLFNVGKQTDGIWSVDQIKNVLFDIMIALLLANTLAWLAHIADQKKKVAKMDEDGGPHRDMSILDCKEVVCKNRSDVVMSSATATSSGTSGTSVHAATRLDGWKIINSITWCTNDAVDQARKYLATYDDDDDCDIEDYPHPTEEELNAIVVPPGRSHLQASPWLLVHPDAGCPCIADCRTILPTATVRDVLTHIHDMTIGDGEFAITDHVCFSGIYQDCVGSNIVRVVTSS